MAQKDSKEQKPVGSRKRYEVPTIKCIVDKRSEHYLWEALFIIYDTRD